MSPQENLLAQCDAMLEHAAGRGPLSEDISPQLLEILAKPKEDREKVPFSDIVALHTALSNAVAPAVPRTIKCLKDDRENRGSWNWLAPAKPVRRLVYAALTFSLFLIILQSRPELISDLMNGIIGCATDDGNGNCTNKMAAQTLLILQLFVIGGLGACFSGLYDSFNYLREGTYDDSLASTYVIRVLIGAFAGVILGYWLIDYIHATAPDDPPAPGGNGEPQDPFDSKLLAFIGGFSAQVVYDLLNRISEAIGTMFRPDRRRERRTIDREKAVELREKLAAEAERQRKEDEELELKSEQIADLTLRAKWLRQARMQVRAGKSAADIALPDGSGGATDSTSLARRIRRALARLDETAALNGLLPDDEAEAREEAASKVSAALSAARARLPADPAVDVPAAVRTEIEELLVKAEKIDPLADIVLKSVASLSPTVSNAEAGLVARALVGAAAGFEDEAYQRWKVAVLDATPATASATISVLSRDAVRAALAADDVDPALAGALADDSDIDRFLALSAAGEHERLRETIGAAFPDATQFDAAVNAMLLRLIRSQSRRDLDPGLRDTVRGYPGAAALMELVDLTTDEAAQAAKASVHRIAVIANRIRSGDVDRAEVDGLIRSAAPTDGGQ